MPHLAARLRFDLVPELRHYVALGAVGRVLGSSYPRHPIALLHLPAGRVSPAAPAVSREVRGVRS